MLKYLLKQDDYRVEQYKLKYGRFEEFEELYSIGFVGAYLFDEMKKYDGIPSQKEFVDEGTRIAIEYFEEKPIQHLYRSNRDYVFRVDDRLINAIENRVARSYTSYILEEQVSEFLESYDVKQVKNTHVDVLFGSDITFVDRDAIYYVHITKDNAWSKDLVKRKGNTSPYITFKGKKRYWKRNWKKGHHVLTYGDRFDDRMTVVNGNLLFKEEYLREYFDDLMYFSNNYDTRIGSELESFYKFLKLNQMI